MGVLEILQSIAPPGPPLEPQAGLPGLLQLAAEPEAPGEKKATKEGETASAGATTTEPGMVGRFHERYALRRQPFQNIQRYR